MASVVNYLAMPAVVANGDFGHKNQYLYRDSNDTLLWQFLPWDLDLSFGHQWRAEVSPPYFSDQLFTATSVFFGGFNDIIQRLYREPNFQEMYFRRIRTLSDQILGTPNTPLAESWAWQQFEQGAATIADEAIQDTAEWGIHPNFTRTPAQATDQIQNSYIPQRRSYLTGLSYIPNAQTATADVNFEALSFAAGDGPADEEYFVVSNNEDTAIDLSGWSVDGSLVHAFKPGTVVPANSKLYITADVQGFQTSTSGPRGGQALIIQGNYEGTLSRFGGTLTLSNADQTPVAQLTYQGTDIQGDFNSDGRVNAADYTVWRDSLESDGDLTADGNGDRMVDQADRALWASNYGETAGASLALITAAPDITTQIAVSRMVDSESFEVVVGPPTSRGFFPATRSVIIPVAGGSVDRSSLLLAFATFEAAAEDDELILAIATETSTPSESPEQNLDEAVWGFNS